MIVKRKLFSFIDEDGNLGYCLYNESTGEEKLFSVVEEEREFARGTGSAVYYAEQMMKNKGNKIANKAANRISTIKLGRGMFDDARVVRGTNNWAENRKLSKLSLGKKIDPNIHSLNDIYLINGRTDIQKGSLGKYKKFPAVIHSINHKIPGEIESNKYSMRITKRLFT